MAGVGTGGFNVTNNSPFSAGPPFPALAADNGLSVDPVTGRIVLGNDVGGVTAQLQSVREIDINGQLLRLFRGPVNTDLFGDSIQVYNSVNPNQAAFIGPGLMQINSDTNFFSPATLELQDLNGGTTTQVRQNGTAFQVSDGPPDEMLSLDNTFGVYQMGDIGAVVSGIRQYMDAGPQSWDIRNPVSGDLIAEFSMGTGTTRLGDLNNLTTGAQEVITIATGVHDFSNVAGTAVYSVNGNPGFTGTVAPVNSITVEGGIVTAVS